MMFFFWAVVIPQMKCFKTIYIYIMDTSLASRVLSKYIGSGIISPYLRCFYFPSNDQNKSPFVGRNHPVRKIFAVWTWSKYSEDIMVDTVCCCSISNANPPTIWGIRRPLDSDEFFRVLRWMSPWRKALKVITFNILQKRVDTNIGQLTSITI